MIIDTDVLIWYLRGNENARLAVKEAVPFSVSAVTYMELVRGMRDKRELAMMKSAFGRMAVDVVAISEDASDRACELVEDFSLSNSMELADALIAATCEIRGEKLLTANDKHYRVVDGLEIEVFRP